MPSAATSGCCAAATAAGAGKASGSCRWGSTDLARRPQQPLHPLYQLILSISTGAPTAAATWTQEYSSPCVFPDQFAITPTSASLRRGGLSGAARAGSASVSTSAARTAAGRRPTTDCPFTPIRPAWPPTPVPSTLYAGIQGFLFDPVARTVDRTYRTIDGETWTQVAGLGEKAATAFAFPPRGARRDLRRRGIRVPGERGRRRDLARRRRRAPPGHGLGAGRRRREHSCMPPPPAASTR